MIPREDILAANSLEGYLQEIGHEVKITNGKGVACCPFHEDKSPSMSVDLQRQLWHCFACDIGGTVIDMHMRITNCSVKDALRQLAERRGLKETEPEKPVKTATYIYKDAYGREVMRVDRIETGGKKKFRQYTLDEQGVEQNGIEGVDRVLFRMERWAGKECVCLCEGEKCVAALESLGNDATTNCGGSSGWLPAYAQYLANKRVEIWPDNDEPGEKWLSAVLKSLEGKVAALRIMRLKAPYNDIADMVIAQGKEQCLATVAKMIEDTPWIDKGITLPLLSASEALYLYKKRVKQHSSMAVDLSLWIPSMRSRIRPLMPGDLIVVLADTGVGKTAILTNLAYSQKHMASIFFEIELAAESLTERFIARDLGMETEEVERETKRGAVLNVKGWSNIYISSESSPTVEKMEDIIERSELKIGRRPGMVLVDYIGLMGGSGSKRYERISAAAEGLKQLARKTSTVIVVASQVSRDEDRLEIGLHDSKDSGSIENSGQLVIGAWRPRVDKITLRILKQTLRCGTFDIDCNYDGNKQLIMECDKSDEAQYGKTYDPGGDDNEGD